LASLVRQSEFEFEVHEAEHEVDKILSFYHIIDIHLTDNEYSILSQELIILAEQFEFGEVERLAFEEPPL